MTDEQKPKTIAEEAGLPDNWVPVDVKPLVPQSPNWPGFPEDGSSRFLQGTLPPGFQHDVSFVDTGRGGSRAGGLGLMPLGVQGNPASNAAVQSTSGKVVAAAIAAIPPVVIPPSTSSPGDGLIHGDTIWEIDPAYVLFRDDFQTVDQTGQITSFNSEGGPWFAVNGGSSLSVFNSGPQFPYSGVINLSNNGTANNTSKIIPQTELAQFGWPLLDYPGWKMIFVFGIGRVGAGSPGATFDWSQVSFYMGLANYPGLGGTLSAANSPRPPHFLGLRYDTDTTSPAISDTTFKFEYRSKIEATPTTRDNNQGTVFDTGIVATEGRKYRLEITCTTSGQVLFFFTDGVTTSSTTMAVTQLSTSTTPTVSITTGLGFYGTTDELPWAPGTKATITGGVVSAFNTTLTMIPNSLQATNGQFYMAGSVGPTSDTGAVTTMFPALIPFVAFGNDTVTIPAPTANLKAIQWDFISFVWNPGVGGGTGTPNSTLARYF